MDFPTKKYNIIYADNPWTYDDKAKSGNRGLENKYDTMSIDDLKYLPVETIAADDCFLFMWVTYPLLREGFEVMKSWGFEYKTVAFTWIKENPNGYTNFKTMYDKFGVGCRKFRDELKTEGLI